MARNITGRSEEEPWTENVWDAEEKKKKTEEERSMRK